MVLKSGLDHTVQPEKPQTQFSEQANKDYKREREIETVEKVVNVIGDLEEGRGGSDSTGSDTIAAWKQSGDEREISWFSFFQLLPSGAVSDFSLPLVSSAFVCIAFLSLPLISFTFVSSAFLGL